MFLGKRNLNLLLLWNTSRQGNSKSRVPLGGFEEQGHINFKGARLVIGLILGNSGKNIL